MADGVGGKYHVASTLVISFLFLCFLATLSQTVEAQQTVFSDDFTADKSLNLNLWQENGNVGYNVYKAVEKVVLGYGYPYFNLIESNPSFSSLGMTVSSISDQLTMTTIESTVQFSAPFTLQATVTASQSGGAAFCIWMNGWVGFNGVLNPTAPKYGIWSDHQSQWYNQLLVTSPQLNTAYQLTMAVDSSGSPTLSVSANGQTLGSVIEQSLGTGPLKIVLAQYEADNSWTGVGLNQAIWKDISITVPQSSVSSSPTAPATTNSPTQSSSTSTPKPISNTSTTPIPTNPPSNTDNPSVFPSKTTVKPTVEPAGLNVPVLGAIVAAISLPIAAVGVFLVLKSKRARKDANTMFDMSRLRKPPNYRIIIPLMVVSFSTGLSNSIVTIFTTDITRTFYGTLTSASVGYTSQLVTINTIGVIVASLLLSILVIRFKHKRLFLAGSVFLIVSAVGSYFSLDLQTLGVFYTLEGIGSGLIGVLAAVLIADTLPVEKRGRILGILFASGAIVTFIMTPITGYLTLLGGWRIGFIVLVIPVSLIGLLLSLFMVPSKKPQETIILNGNPYKESFSQIVKNKSAIGCLVANFFTVPGTAIAIYAMTFYRTQLLQPKEVTVAIYEGALILAFIAYLVSGLFIDKFGAKRVAVISTILAAIFTAAFMFIPILWLAATLDMMHVWFGAMGTVAFAALILQQLPKQRGSLFSFNNLINNAGAALAPAIGGVVLVLYSGGYGLIGLIFGGMTIVGSILILAIAQHGETTIKG